MGREGHGGGCSRSVSSEQARARRFNLGENAASANSLLVTGIKKSYRTFAGSISRPTQRVAFVWSEPKRWPAVPATAIFVSPASTQSRACEAAASGRQCRFERTTATSGLPPSNGHRQRRSAGLFRANSRNRVRRLLDQIAGAPRDGRPRHSGTPALRRPSIYNRSPNKSLCATRSEMRKSGSSSSRPATASLASASRPR